MAQAGSPSPEERQVVALRPVRATRARMLALHRRGLITLALPEDDPPAQPGGNTDWVVAITSGHEAEHKLIGVLVDAEVAQPGTHPMAETFHVVAHVQARDPWYLYGLDHTRLEPAAAEASDLAGRTWEQLEPGERAAVERANRARFARGEVEPADMFCLEFGPEAPAELAELVVFSMPPDTIHGELRARPAAGRAPRFYVDELDLRLPPEQLTRQHGPAWFALAGPAVG